MGNNDYLMNEEQIPGNWAPIDSPAVVPGKAPLSAPAPPVPHDMPQFFSGSMPPNLQHDGSFVGTEVGSPRIPKYSLMPLGNQANPFKNAAAQSTVIKEVNTFGGSGIKLKTNGSDNPNQAVLDLEPGNSNVTLAADGSGAVRISVAGSSGLFTARNDFKRWFLWTNTGNGTGVSTNFGSFCAIGDTLLRTDSGSTTFNLVSASATDDFGQEIVPQALGGAYGAITGLNNCMIPARDFSFFCPVRISTNAGNLRIWVILSNPNNSGDVSAIATADAPNRDIVGFRYSSGVSPNWFAVMAKVNPGGGLTAVDTGVAASTNPVMLRVDYSAATTTATYSINGVVVATINTNPPTINFGLGGMISINNTSGSSNALRISTFYAEMRTTVTTS